MSSTLISIGAILLYLTATALLFYRFNTLRHAPCAGLFCGKKPVMGLTLLALLLHAVALSQDIFLAPGLNLGVTNAASLITWLIALILVLANFRLPLDSLIAIFLPAAALTLLVEQVIPSNHIVSADISKELKFHILISILAYSTLTVAAIQSLIILVQDRHLRSRQPGGLIRALPPLQTMETLLFQIIAIGFTLHTIALATGLLFIENMFAQHLVHKTILSVIAWSVFATLLWGRHYHGWRGRTAIRWTLSGFALLFLAYFGSKVVLEMIIAR
ncbi:Inner membrane protein YpjD [hydrothermal vent metagenome]|uniref:Inner membrane protein YpjD n=1 Tax=hydrothermal vent metagenome TaxID=652676 RepID=A0A3B1AC44_9ZZZZ